MKFFIIGLHSSGKQEVINILEKNSIKCGKLFSNLENPSECIYNSLNYEFYSNDDINNIFENNAYLFIKELQNFHLDFKVNKYYEGLSKYNFDQNDVFALSPDQVLAISPTALKDDICFIWMDNTKNNRTCRYHSERRTYNYKERDDYEKHDISSFVKTIHSFNAPILYFTNEEPSRVAAIIHTIIKHPDTFDMFVKNFN